MSVTIPESFYTSLLAGVGVVQENVIKTFNLVLMISKWTDFFKVQRLITYRVSLRTDRLYYLSIGRLQSRESLHFSLRTGTTSPRLQSPVIGLRNEERSMEKFCTFVLRLAS